MYIHTYISEVRAKVPDVQDAQRNLAAQVKELYGPGKGKCNVLWCMYVSMYVCMYVCVYS